jgi:glycine/D-amino acid oxidase-like deaminating enzyme
LFLASDKGKEVLLANHKTQTECGADWMQLMSPAELKAKFPWLNTDGVVMGSYGSKNEGFFDPWSLISGLKAKSRAMGVDYIDGEATAGSVTQVNIGSRRVDSIDITSTGPNGVKTVQTVKAGTFINAAGSWSPLVMEMLIAKCNNPGAIFKLPIERKKRSIFSISSSPAENAAAPPVPDNTTPLTIDPTGAYFRAEKSMYKYITGISPPEDKDPGILDDSELRNTDHTVFDETLWPTLYNRVPAFERLKVTNFWSGFYDYNIFDQNAIIGYHPQFSNLIVCTGFSGHGLQQSPGSGRAVSEIVAGGQNWRYTTIDVNRFGFERLIDKKPLYETGIV